MAFNIAKVADWLHRVDKARAVVGWWPAEFATDDERLAYKVQDAFLKKQVVKQGPLVGYKIALTSPQILAQTGLKGPAYGPIRRKRVFEHKATVRADRWTRLGAELEIILTVNADVPKPKAGKPYDRHSIAPFVGSARAGFELIEDRGADYSRLAVNPLIMDAGWNGGSLLARPNKDWHKLDLGNLKGSIAFNGHEIQNSLPDKLVPLGLSFVPQEKNVFTSMTCEENLEMGAFTRRDDFRDTLAMVYDMFPPVKEKRHQKAGELSGGQRQMVAMGRALMSNPKLLMLDEPSAGLSPRYVIEIFETVVRINKAGVGILMVEQNARQALAFASKGFVLANGQNRFTGTGAELIADPEVAKSFLGG